MLSFLSYPIPYPRSAHANITHNSTKTSPYPQALQKSTKSKLLQKFCFLSLSTYVEQKYTNRKAKKNSQFSKSISKKIPSIVKKSKRKI